jgi:DNA-directed RNA polymerase specialized sigma24 family protein
VAALSQFVRARVPEDEVRDIVQSTIADALDAERPPEGDEDVARWVHGICRHKVVDWFRRAKREVPRDLESPEDGPTAAVLAAVDSAPQSALDLLRWAKKELPAGAENEKTLEWMLREGEGEKLEAIAAEANLPAARVRQRVSRLRRYYKARWAAQAAAVAALLLVALAIAFALRRRGEDVAPAPGPSLVPKAVPSMLPPGPEPLPPERPARSTTPPPPAPAPSETAPTDSSDPGPRMDPPWGTAPVPSSSVPSKYGKPRGKGPAVGGKSGFDPLLLPQRSSEVPPPPAPSEPLDSWGARKPGSK